MAAKLHMQDFTARSLRAKLTNHVGQLWTGLDGSPCAVARPASGCCAKATQKGLGFEGPLPAHCPPPPPMPTLVNIGELWGTRFFVGTQACLDEAAFLSDSHAAVLYSCVGLKVVSVPVLLFLRSLLLANSKFHVAPDLCCLFASYLRSLCP